MAILHCGILGQAKLHVSWTMHGINRNFCHGVTITEWRVFTSTVIYRTNNVLCINNYNADLKRYLMWAFSLQRKVPFPFSLNDASWSDHFRVMVTHISNEKWFYSKHIFNQAPQSPLMKDQLWYFSMDVLLFEYHLYHSL